LAADKTHWRGNFVAGRVLKLKEATGVPVKISYNEGQDKDLGQAFSAV
jgi:hypothetical protein